MLLAFSNDVKGGYRLNFCEFLSIKLKDKTMTPSHRIMILNKLATAPYCIHVQVDLSSLRNDELIAEFLRVERLIFQLI